MGTRVLFKVLFGILGVWIFAGSVIKVKSGGYPAGSRRVSRVDNSVNFWLVVILNAMAGVSFIALSIVA